MSTIHVIRAVGSPVPANTWGRCTLLLRLLSKQGLLPECSLYERGDNDLFINNVNLGSTEDQIVNGIWKMVENYRDHGYLFE